MPESLKENREKWQAMGEKARRKPGLNPERNLSLNLWEYADHYYSGDAFQKFWEQLTRVYGKAPTGLRTVEEFWNPAMKEAVAYLVGDKLQKDMEEMTRMRLDCQFSASMYRRSYRSGDLGYHASYLCRAVASWIHLVSYDRSVREILDFQHDWVRGFDMYLALEIRRENPEIISFLKEAILGENQQMQLSATMIRAIIISGHEELLDLLLKLLLAARLQEGLRQQILEQADAGSIEVLIRILKLCLEEDLFRYSSTVRALETWTGLGFQEAKPAVIRKYAGYAYEYLTDENERKKSLDSENNLEAYFAIWATACHEMSEADELIPKLLDAEQKHRRILGWYFVSCSDSPGFQMHQAQNYLMERDEELLAWITANLAVTSGIFSVYGWEKEGVHPRENQDLPGSLAERRKLFEKLADIAAYIGGKNRTFTGNPFSFSSITLENTRVLSCMMSIAAYDLDSIMIEKLEKFLPFMDIQQRNAFYVNFLEPKKSGKHREYLREALHDRSIQVKESAVKKLSKCSLLAEDMEALAESLRSKSSGLRKSVIDILKSQDMALLAPVISKMLISEEEYQVQAGIELLLELRTENPEAEAEQREYIAALGERKLSTQTEILLEQLLEKQEDTEEAWTEENGFGLYDPTRIVPETARIQATAEPDVTEPERIMAQAVTGPAGEKQEKRGFFSRLLKKAEKKSSTEMKRTDAENQVLYTEKELEQMLLPSSEEFWHLFDRMNQVFENHADYEYEIRNYDGSHSRVLFGSLNYNSVPLPAGCEYQGRTWLSNNPNAKLSMIPFYQEFVEAVGDYARNLKKWLGMYYVTSGWNGGYSSGGMEYQPWFEEIVKKKLAVSYSGYDKYKNRYWQMRDILLKMQELYDAHELFSETMTIYRSMIRVMGEENLGRNCVQKKKDVRFVYYGSQEAYPLNHRMVGVWRTILAKTAQTPEDFAEWFLCEYRIEHVAAVSVYSGLGMEEYFKAVHAKLVEKEALYERLLVGKAAETEIRFLTNPNRFLQGKAVYDTYPWAKAVVDKAVLRIVEVEECRGELPTPLTGVARAIERFEGAEHFVKLLAALGKDNFFRGYAYSSDTTKRAVLSRLLKRCYPAAKDTAEKLKEYLARTDVTEKRLAEAVMYAPQWADFAEEILGWPGLKCGVWFFHAHINESFSAEKETEVALYSPITPQQFNDGAFDKDWFFAAYHTLGEKRFQILYKSAKYITSGSNQHRRSQLYTDAVLGRLDADSLEAEIAEKRNQEKLRCYPLIPISEGDSGAVLHRYEFIQKFLKESRQFGAQRRESEKKACSTAMENLAMTAGFSDVNRLTWFMESEKMEELRPWMEPQNLADGVTVRLEIREDGTAELAVEKNGKPLKTLPKALNKDETVLALKEAVKELKEQKRRAKDSLERAMTECTEFRAEELKKLMNNPVLAPMVKALLWTDGSETGFLQKEPGTTLRIAHPHDMMEQKCWTKYMHLLYQEQLVQPFKQVFREYYPLTEEERQEKNISRRYAGYQVQPQKTVALLKSRGWTVDYEEGLQKVFYKENLIVRMYALADWFSPADIEAPTLEIIRFYDRNTGEIVDFDKIPPILFSEAMRDMDLAVSVAHVGGVDPEASHSTIEMRKAIAAELVQLLHLGNVTFIGTHARIIGALASYSVHLGSGVVHADAIGMLAILPVHSQSRGRIFLPFADDDPKTAEIMSKIILLAEDKKIKDPSILRQLS